MSSLQHSLSDQLRAIISSAHKRKELHPQLSVRNNLLHVIQSKTTLVNELLQAVDDYCLTHGLVLDLHAKELQLYPHSFVEFMRLAKEKQFKDISVDDKRTVFVNEENQRVAIALEEEDNIHVFCSTE